MPRDPVERWLRQLGSRNAETQQTAAAALARQGPEWVPTLCRRATHPNARVRQGAVLALRDSDDPEARDALHAALNDRDRLIRIEAAIALGKGDAAAGSALRRVLRERWWLGLRHSQADRTAGRVRAVLALSGHPGPETTATLCEILAGRKEDPEVRVAAARALARADGPDAIGALCGACEVGDRRLLLTCIDACAEIGNAAVPTLLDELGKSPRRANMAAAVLVQIGQAASPALLPLLEEPDHRLRSRAAALLVAGGHIDPGAIADLVHALEDPVLGLRDVAARALGLLARKRPTARLRLALPVLRRLLSGWNRSDPELQDSYRTITRQIERATAELPDLPLPAATPPIPLEQLPVPGRSTRDDEADLPLPSEQAGPLSPGPEA